jgi:hypothetical protein
VSDQKDLGKNLEKAIEQQALLIDESIELVGKAPLVGGVIRNTLTSPVEGVIDYFYENDSGLYIKGLDGKPVATTDSTKTQNYGVNGIMTPLETALENYVNQEGHDITLRHNPTSGFLGDLIESGLGKTLGMIAPGTSAMAVLVAGDMLDRKDIDGATNLFHSQGSIIGKGAMQVYSDEFMKPITLTNPITGEVTTSYVNQINQTQRFVAVGPAVGEGDWKGAVEMSLHLKFNKKDYRHDPQDPVLQLAAPSNLVSDIANLFTTKPVNSPIYIPNLIVDLPLGAWNAIFHMDKHDVKNPYYQEPLHPTIHNPQSPSTAPPKNN